MSERTASIPVTQYILPNGRQVQQEFQTTTELAILAQKVIEAGYRFEAEVLRTGEVSMDCCKGSSYLSWAICDNGPEVIDTMDRVVRAAAQSLEELQSRGEV